MSSQHARPEDDRWKQRFRAPSIWSAFIAPLQPERGLTWADPGGTLQYHAWDVPAGTLRQLTHTSGGHSTHLNLSPDGEWVYYLQDHQGNEIGHFMRMPYAGGEPVDITPEMPPYSEMGFGFARSGACLGFTTAAPSGFDTFLIDIARDGRLGKPRQISHLETICEGPQLSADGRIALMMSSEHSGKNEFSLVAIDTATGTRITELWDGDGTSITTFTGFSPLSGDPRILAQTNRSGIERLLVWNPLTGERQDLDLAIPGAHYGADWSADGDRILVQILDRAEISLAVYHLPDSRMARLNPPPGDYSPLFARGGEAVFAIWSDAGHNSRIVELDPINGHLVGTPLLLTEAPSGHIPRSITFQSSDGASIQGWLCLPEGSGPFPTVLETHGGPTGVKTNSFDPTAQAWVDHGFAFLSINYHGSITFGRDFEQKIWQDLGHWEVEDMNAAHAWLVREGIAQPDAIFLTGWSYGGYLTLMGLGKNPELWAGGMAGVTIADWSLQWEDTADSLRGYQEALLGGTPQEKPEQYRASSPISYVEAVSAPLLIIQGRNDTRTPARPVRIYEEKMRALGKEIEIVWFDSGHIGAFADKELGISHLEKMIHFAQDVLKRMPGASH